MLVYLLDIHTSGLQHRSWESSLPALIPSQLKTEAVDFDQVGQWFSPGLTLSRILFFFAQQKQSNLVHEARSLCLPLQSSASMAPFYCVCLYLWDHSHLLCALFNHWRPLLQPSIRLTPLDRFRMPVPVHALSGCRPLRLPPSLSLSLSPQEPSN